MYIIFFLLIQTLYAAPARDEILRSRAKAAGVKALNEYVLTDEDRAIYSFGHELFRSKLISGNKNISCATCHTPKLGTGDQLPLPIGEGGEGMGINRKLGTGRIIARHTPPLYNLGHEDMNVLFLDGRVEYSRMNKIFTTPEKLFNGPAPVRQDYVQFWNHALDAMVMFPIVNHDEMRGLPGTNEIADAKDNFEAWDKLWKRIINDELLSDLAQKSFPDKKLSELNFAVVGKALSQFIKYQFQTPNTPWDKFVKGDDGAMSGPEKNGALLFYGKAQCSRCHSGTLLSDQLPHSVSLPHLGNGPDGDLKDLGAHRINPIHSKYSFRTPPLRNVALTAPYGHTGSFVTLEEVMDHYIRPHDVVDFNVEKLIKYYPAMTELYKLSPKDVAEDQLQHLDSLVNRGIEITEKEKNDIISFLKISLTEN